MEFGKFIAFLLLLSIFIVSAKPQTLTVKTNKKSYRPGDLVTIEVKGVPKANVGIEVRDPANRLVYVKQIRLDNNGFGSCAFELSNYSILGVYTIYVASTGFFTKYNFTVEEKTVENTTMVNLVFIIVDSAGNVVKDVFLKIDGREFYSKDGVFSINLEKGVYKILVLKNNVIVYEDKFEIETSQTYQIKLDLYTIKIMVLDFLGRPVSNVEVKLLKNDVEVDSKSTDEAGIAIFQYLQKGLYNIVIGENNVEVELNDNLALTVRLKPPWYIWLIIFLVLIIVFYVIIKKFVFYG